ncbi:hypothetical protein FY050_23945 [Phyllobacterium endophyticum]|uniref:Peptidase metallopeptidase domain-containing protein n=2 Tax=Phyllobacterium endophyticum TaxID=1149773 RepID=A0A2P7AVT8_9HYPH|nr:hypothetical protein CU100_12020 [Phyllobacterium endophyticum]TYR39016.1 hypothetical protein FY050_23945 [Phyllobacterium endophyticum]
MGEAMCRYCSYINQINPAEEVAPAATILASARFTEAPDAAADTTTAYALGAGETAQGDLSVLGDHDWYRVNLVAGQTYTFNLAGSGNTPVVDTYLRLHDANGNQIAFDDDSGVGASSSLVFTAAASGVFFVNAGAYNDAATGQYALSFTQANSQTDPTVSEAADAAANTATTYALAGGETLRGTLGSNGDHDWVRIELVAGQTYSFSMTGTGAAAIYDTYLRLRDSAGTQIAYDDDSGAGNNSTLIFTATTSGTYYLDAGAYNDAYAGQYDLTVSGQTGTVQPPVAPEPPAVALTPARLVETADAAAAVTTSYTLAIGKTAQGQLSAAGDVDWFRINLIAGQTYTFAMVATGNVGVRVNDTYLSLRNSTGAEIIFDDDTGPGSNSTITYTATSSGEFYLAAGSYNNTSPGQYGLSATAGNKASYDELMGAAALTRPGTSWSAPGTAANVTWGVRATNPNATDADGNPTAFIPLTAAQIAAVQGSLGQFSDVANIAFTQVNPGGTTDNATILAGAYSSNADGAGAYAIYPGPAAAAGDINLNNMSVSTTSLPQGSYSYFAVLHELGHAIGLAHPGDYNAAAGVVFNYANSAASVQDDHQYSVMSYFDESSTTGSYNSYPDTLMLYDILAVQQLYGANMSTRSGDTVYGFNTNAGSIYDFAVNTTPALSIWDAGGSDTINASGFGQNQKINLHDGTFSDIGGLTGNVSIAFNATIENAIGGSGDDVLAGNSVRNVLTGNGGADTFVFKDLLSAAFNVDTIMDFGAATDRILLDASIFTALSPGGPLSGDAFCIGAAAGDTSDRIIYNSGTGALSYDQDGAGGYAAVQFASLNGGLSLTSGNFQVA